MNITGFSVLLMMYILIQPILDVITGWQVRIMPHFGLTLGIVVRAIMLLAILYFIAMAAKENKNWLDRHIWWYFLCLALIIVINLAVNKFNKPVFASFTEIAAIFKSLHYIVILVGFYYAFRNLSKQQLAQLMPKVFYWAEMIINVVMIAAAITHTSFSTYPQGKMGQTGWFNAGNELGAILAILFPLVVLYALKRSHAVGQYWTWIGVIFAALSIIMVGTKSCFYGMIIGLIFAFVYQIIIYFFWPKHTKDKKNILISLALTCLIVVGITVSYPVSPVHTNSVIQAKIVRENRLNKLKLLHKRKTANI